MLEIILGVFAYVFVLFGYVSTGNIYKEPLSKSEEEYLLKKHFEKDKEARRKLIEHNIRLVAHIAKKYSVNAQELEEYTSIGTIGLIKGIDSFSMDKGFKLSTYISRCVENEILMTLRNQKKNQQEVSINSVIGIDKDGNDMELIDVVESKGLDQADEIYNKILTKQVIEYINNELSDRERKIAYLRYGLNGKKELTQQEVADVLNISRSYVSRIETKIQNKLKNNLQYDKY